MSNAHSDQTVPADPSRTRVIVFGASGTAGSGVVRALITQGYDVTCAMRDTASGVTDAAVIGVDIISPDGIDCRGFDIVISCIASRSGTAKDAWAIDHDAQLNILRAAQRANIRQFILLSAICVQKPRLAFQYAKLAFEARLEASGLTYSIVRPTAFFKSLSGQIARVKAGKPFLFSETER